GSFFSGFQVGYDTMLPNRVVLGVTADASYPAFPNLEGISIGGSSTFFSPAAGGFLNYSETVLHSGTVRARVGYAPRNWLLYATGGFAWSYNQLTLTQPDTGTTDAPFLWRFGWVGGAGVETTIIPHWTASLEYLFKRYDWSTVTFPSFGQRFASDFSVQEL